MLNDGEKIKIKIFCFLIKLVKDDHFKNKNDKKAEN
jgi:hypothetical protein